MSNYDKEPFIVIKGMEHEVWEGYTTISEQIEKKVKDKGKTVIVIECYPAVRIDEIINGLMLLNPCLIIPVEEAALEAQELENKLSRYLTEDRVFGYMAPYNIEEFYDEGKLNQIRSNIDAIEQGVVIVIGFGASLVTDHDILLYADLARWEIQQRYRSKEFGNWRANNHDEDILRKYKRSYFIEWRVADRLKRALFQKLDFYLDTNKQDEPKMVTISALKTGLKQAISQPFRLVPYFDPGVWGGNWLEEKIGLEPKGNPYAWGFDGVPEENSLYFQYGQTRIELPSINLVFFESTALLGEKVYARFGAEFPIRFDFLDTMGGQNLSLQVHPLTDYIKEKFGMSYTQDESYYMLDAGEDSIVYLGLKEGIDPERMMDDLEQAQQGAGSFPAENYVNIFPAKKHDHFLIPAGTVHCSGINSMVLEISATPYIFTFKLWDWDRLGLDGKPRPVHLQHGSQNIMWERDTDWVQRNLVGQVQKLGEGQGWVEERTGLHELEFIETRRHWFTEKVMHHTNGGVQVLNLIEGEEAIIESPIGAFTPLVIHYAETVIIPADVGGFTLRPSGNSEGKQIGTLKAFVRT